MEYVEEKIPQRTLGLAVLPAVLWSKPVLQVLQAFVCRAILH